MTICIGLVYFQESNLWVRVRLALSFQANCFPKFLNLKLKVNFMQVIEVASYSSTVGDIMISSFRCFVEAGATGSRVFFVSMSYTLLS